LDFRHIFQFLIFLTGISHERDAAYHEQYRTPPQLVGTVGFPSYWIFLPHHHAVSMSGLQQDFMYFPDLNSTLLPITPSTPTAACTIDHHNQPQLAARSSLHIPKQRNPRNITLPSAVLLDLRRSAIQRCSGSSRTTSNLKTL